MADKGEDIFDGIGKDEKRNRPHRDEEIEVKFRFKRSWLRNIERGLYLAIILVLLYFVLVKPIVKECPFGKKLLSQPTAITPAPAAATPVAKEEAKKPLVNATENKSKAEVKKEPEAASASAPPAAGVGNVTIALGAIEVTAGEKLNTSEDFNYRYRVQSIMLSINNQKGNFQPVLRVYWYPDSEEAAVKLKKKAEINVSIIPIGIKPLKLDDEIPDYMRAKETDDEANFKVELYNAKGMELLASESVKKKLEK
ncbi:hypothetical protein HYU13_01735 [Candidatus Woesearchaeota archaeon]|nr:hypothetical protein [Candidatus Woesearchaeota archaeon]